MVLSWTSSREARALAASRRGSVVGTTGSAGAAAASAAAINNIAGSSLNTGLASSASPGPRCPIRAMAASRMPAVFGDNARILSTLPSLRQRPTGWSLRKSRGEGIGLRSYPAAFHDRAKSVHPEPGLSLLKRHRRDTGVDQPQRRQNPALVNPIPQQRNPNPQTGIRQQAQLRRSHVLCLRSGHVGPRVGPQMPQRGQRARRGHGFGDRPQRTARPAGADRTGRAARPATGRPGRAGRRPVGPSRATARRRRRWPIPRRRDDGRTPRWPCSPIRRRSRRQAQAPDPAPG